MPTAAEIESRLDAAALGEVRVRPRTRALTLAATVALSAMFALLVGPALGVLHWEHDEGWYALGARFLSEGRRPFVDFAYIQPPVFLHLLAASAEAFGSTIAGFRMLSLASLCGSGVILFLLVRPVMGVLPALLSQAVFLFSTTQVHALGAVPDTPMMLMALLGALLLFHGRSMATTWAAAAAFVAALYIKPTCLLMVGTAAVSLLLAGDTRRFIHLALAGTVFSLLGLAWVNLASDGAFVDALEFQLLERFGRGRTNNWVFPSGFIDIRRAAGIEHIWDLGLFAAREFVDYPVRTMPLVIAAVSIAGAPFWVALARRHGPLCWFAVLAPLSFLVVDFLAMDFVSAKYFVPFPSLVALLLAGLVWGVTQRLPRPAAAVAAAAVAASLSHTLAAALPEKSDPWYQERATYLAEEGEDFISFSPIFFIASGEDPGCGLWNPALVYGEFGLRILTAEGMRRFRVSDADLIACLRGNPDARMLVDFWYYFFTQGRGELTRYLHGEGKDRVVFFSPTCNSDGTILATK